MIIRIYLSLLLCLLSSILTAQDRIKIDFGPAEANTASHGKTNNISTDYPNGVLLYDTQGLSTDINIKTHDDWVGKNNLGTDSPNYQLGIPKTASEDYFYGSDSNPTAGFILSHLDTSKFYSFSFFASRINVTDNRETNYTIIGNNTNTISINPSNNNTQKVSVLNIQPDANGEIKIEASAGINNNNSSGFYYINALEIQVSMTSITQLLEQISLELIYPNSNSVWESGKTISIKWESENVDMVDLEYSIDGNTFTPIATVPATDGNYDFTVPNQTSNNAIIRISSSTQMISSSPITIIPDDGVVYRIIILGSSTAAGSGPSNKYNAWIWKYSRHLKELDTRYEVINLAQGGFVTYNILPDGTTIPSGINETININRNITKALSLNAHAVIINLPSNDAANNYSVTDQSYNYNLILNTASTQNVLVWTATPQPRNFTNNSSQHNIQVQMVTETYNLFGNNNTVDFWTGLGNTNGNAILTQFDSGDHVHANNEAHQIFYERMFNKGIHNIVKTAVDAALNIDTINTPEIKLYPNPTSNLLFIENSDEVSKIDIYNQIGQKIHSQTNNNSWINVKHLKSGFYIVHLHKHYKVIRLRFIKN